MALADAPTGRADALDQAADHPVGDDKNAPDHAAPDGPVDGASPEGGPTPQDLRTGLVGYWKMDDRMGSLAATDSVGGEPQKAVLESLDAQTLWERTGKFEFALEMPDAGRAGGLRVGVTAAIDGIFHYTLAAWIRRTRSSPTSYEYIISRQVGDTDFEVFGLLVYHDRLRAFAPHSEPFRAADIVAPTPLPIGTWVHVAVTYNGEIMTLYQDGERLGTLPHPLTRLAATNKPLYIGTNKNSQPGPAEPFVGWLDEVLLYSVALAPEQIQALSEGTRP